MQRAHRAALNSACDASGEAQWEQRPVCVVARPRRCNDPCARQRHGEAEGRTTPMDDGDCAAAPRCSAARERAIARNAPRRQGHTKQRGRRKGRRRQTHSADQGTPAERESEYVVRKTRCSTHARCSSVLCPPQSTSHCSTLTSTTSLVCTSSFACGSGGGSRSGARLSKTLDHVRCACCCAPCPLRPSSCAPDAPFHLPLPSLLSVRRCGLSRTMQRRPLQS